MLATDALKWRLLPPWPEWSDAELNQEQWDPPPITTPQPSEMSVEMKPEFIHPLGSYWLPPSLSDLVADYVRPVVKGSQILPHQESVLPHLNERGQELVNYSPALKAIFSAITGVARLQAEPPFPLIEGTSNTFLPSAGPPWRPWHHVYSMNKAGKGVGHKPLVNPAGKYVVRLWYMGAWRSIAVDDRIPVDEYGQALLPGDVTGALWAPLLTKALLAVGALSWSDEDELRGWDPVCCLTGWLSLPLPVDCQQLQLPTVWRLCVAALAPEGTDLMVEDLHSFQEVAAEDPFGGQPQGKVGPLDAVSENMGTAALVVQAEDSPGAVVVHGAGVLWNAIRYRDRPPTPPWKRYRWKAWALRHGLIQERGPELYRTLRVFCPLGRLQAPPLPSMDDAGGDSAKSTTAKTNTARSAASSPKKGKQVAVQDKRDSSLDLEWLASRLRGLRLLLRPSSFASAARLLDVPGAAMDAKPALAGGRKGSASAGVPVVAAVFPGCLYALLDAPHAKKLVLALDAVADPVLAAWEQRLAAAAATGDAPPSVSESEVEEASLLVERYVWSAATPEQPLLCLATGNCRLLSLPAGQCALRLWCSRLPRHHCLTLLAQDQVFLGSREQVQERLALSAGSMLKAQADAVREAALQALRPDPGTPEHVPAVAGFLDACSPPPPPDDALEAPLRRHYLKQALIEMARVAKPSDPAAVAHALVELQLFFADEELNVELLDETEEKELQLLLETEPGVRNVSSGSQLTASIKMSSTATRDSKNKGKPAKGGKKGKSEYSERYRVLVELMTPADSGQRVLSALLCGRPQLQALYPCGWDLDGLAALWDCRGVSATEGGHAWLALALFSLNHCRAASPRSLCALSAVVSVPRWNLSVVEEATGRLVAPLLGEPQPFSFRPGGSYSVLLSCWPPPDARDIFWRVRALARHRDELPHCCSFPLTGRCEPQPDPPAPRQLECSGPYVPGKEGLIFRALLLAHTLPLPVALRVAVSNAQARFRLRFKRGDDEVLVERSCTGEVTVPLIMLERRSVTTRSSKVSEQPTVSSEQRETVFRDDRRRKPVMFVVEAHLLRDSWPLTPEERVGADAALAAARRRLLVFSAASVRQETVALSSQALALSSSKTRAQRHASVAAARSPSRARSAASRRRLAASPVSTLSLEEALPPGTPTWNVSLALTADEESVELRVDDRRERTIRTIKESWEQKEPGRAHRAQNLRRSFQPRQPLALLLRAAARKEEQEEEEVEEVLLTPEAVAAERASRHEAQASWAAREAVSLMERALLLAEQPRRHGRLGARWAELRRSLDQGREEALAARDALLAACAPPPSAKKSKK